MRCGPISVVLLFFLSTSLAGAAVPVALAQPVPALRVAASIAPLAAIVTDVCGENVEVLALLPEGVEPHAFSATPEMVLAAQDSDLLVLTGHFPWENEITSQTSTPYISLADYEEYGARLSPLPGLMEENQSSEESNNGNPHGYWLLPTNALAIANATRVVLSLIEPSLASQFEEGFNSMVHRVGDLHTFVGELDQELHFTEMRSIVVFPAEAYIAEAFGIEVRGVLQIGDNIFISGSALLEIQTALSNGSIGLILGSDVGDLQTGGEFARQLVLDTGASLVWWRAVFSGSADYVGLMMYNLGALASVLRNSGGNAGDTTLLIVLAAIAVVLGLVALGEGVVLIQRAKAM